MLLFSVHRQSMRTGPNVYGQYLFAACSLERKQKFVPFHVSFVRGI